MTQLSLPFTDPERFVAFSGGKDSTALAYRLAELGEPFKLLFTPTGNELPDVMRHVRATSEALQREVVIPKGPSLYQLIDEFNALPNNRQRWCTRMIKIVPCIAYLKAHPGAILYVGLRADEETRKGLYSEFVHTHFPMQTWGWSLENVLSYLQSRQISVPVRTDCAFCYDQRLIDWKNLLRNHPALYAKAEGLEERTGHTFRSPSRDGWPANLSALRVEFESGRKIRGEDKAKWEACRVCRL